MLDFIMGDANDSCVGDLTVYVQVKDMIWNFTTRSIDTKIKAHPKHIDWGKVIATNEIMDGYVMPKYRNKNFLEDDSWIDIIMDDVYNTFYRDEEEEAKVAKASEDIKLSIMKEKFLAIVKSEKARVKDYTKLVVTDGMVDYGKEKLIEDNEKGKKAEHHHLKVNKDDKGKGKLIEDNGKEKVHDIQNRVGSLEVDLARAIKTKQTKKAKESKKAKKVKKAKKAKKARLAELAKRVKKAREAELKAKEEKKQRMLADIYAAGSKSRPPMLNKENYVLWSSRLLRYAKSRPNEKLIHNSILNGPYVRGMIPEPGDAERDVNVNETFHEQTDDELSERELKQIEANDQAIQTILLGLPEDIYAAVDSCETAQEIWLRVQQMMKGSNIGIQEKKAKLFNEWERFTSNEGESIESYYYRFLKLMNDLKRNKHFPEKIASNLKFLNNLQPE
nr:hypothetical protein [Tanacetum cinerariifolium]